MGNALDEGSDIGAIISEEQLKRTLHYMDIAKQTLQLKLYMVAINQKVVIIKTVSFMSLHLCQGFL